ncbi:MAG: RluA family pseudouridine synthase [Fretibacterium sp.]|nr:RluA family pseudouridine synthase [Fretibacterium sp.]
MSFRLVLTKDHDGRRLDRTLRSIWPNLPLSAVMKGLRKGYVRLDAVCVRDPAARVRAGQELYVRWDEPEAKALPRHRGALSILWRGDGALVLNKPANLLVQPDTAGGDSVITRVWSLGDAPSAGFAPAAVHRLDRNTTGVLIVALAGDSLRALERLFKERDLLKEYLAVVVGDAPPSGEVDAPLLKDSALNTVRVDPEGKEAHTRFYRLAGGKESSLSLVRVELLTGRTHQARVHLAHAGLPILGDRKYGNFEANRRWKQVKRPMLHAWTLTFPEELDPSLAELSGRSFKAPVPGDMAGVFRSLGWNDIEAL